MKNLILNFSWESFSNLPPTQMLAVVLLVIIAFALLTFIALSFQYWDYRIRAAAKEIDDRSRAVAEQMRVERERNQLLQAARPVSKPVSEAR